MSKRRKHKPKRQRPLSGNSKTKWWRNPAIGLALTILGLLLSLLSLTPRPTVSPMPVLNQKNPFSAPFIISNEGWVPLKDVRVESQILEMEDSNHNRFTVASMSRYTPPAARIEPGEKHSVPLAAVSIQGVRILRADVQLIVRYRSAWVPIFEKTNTFRFVLSVTSGGAYHWLPRAKTS